MVTRQKFVYAPKPGDEVRWPNGLIMRYLEAPEDCIAVTGVPEDDTLTVDSLGGAWMIEVVQ